MDNSKKSAKNNKIKNYFEGNTLNLEKLISDFEDYVYIIIMNSGIKICQEDIEEIKLDVFIAIWKNQKKLDKEYEVDIENLENINNINEIYGREYYVDATTGEIIGGKWKQE